MSNQSPEEIQAEIEQQREQLAGTLDALSAKLDVKSQAQAKVAEVKADVKERTTDDSGRPRAELIVLGATVVVVAVALVWWRRR
jgi:cobalamin biosynthesis Mg chelatase CobN